MTMAVANIYFTFPCIQTAIIAEIELILVPNDAEFTLVFRNAPTNLSAEKL